MNSVKEFKAQINSNIYGTSLNMLLSCSALAVLAACGGGGGSTAIAPPPIVNTALAPAPTVSVALSRAKATVGSSVTLTWSSTDATSCVGLDNTAAGPKPISGGATITPTTSGQITYTISCDGAGGTTNKSTTLTVPIPVTTNSYANWKEIGLTATVFPTESYIGMGQKAPTAYGWADFFHTGARDLFTANIKYLGSGPNGLAADYTTITNDPQYHSDFQFWRQNIDGNYTKLWETKGCKHPRKALVADFNRDGYPDIYVACHDIAAEAGISTSGEYSWIVMSDGKGSFNAYPVPGTMGYYHGATAADFNNDGYSDIYLSNNLLLLNNKDGTFTPTGPVISLAIFPGEQAQYYSYEAVDIDDDGNIDLIAGGDEQQAHGNPLDITTAIFYGDGKGHFNRYKKLPTVTGRGLVLDFTVITNNGVKSLYIARTSGYDSGLTGSQCYSGSYCTNTLQLVNLSTMESTVLFDYLTLPQIWSDQTNLMPWWLPDTKNGVTSFYAFLDDNLR